MPYIKEYFAPEYITLQQEISKHHPKLVEILSNQPNPTLEVRLAEVAAYCDVLLDGHYLPEELINLAKILTERLIKKRSGLLII